MNLYNCIVFFKDINPVKYHKVNNIEKLTIWLLRNKPSALYINVYDRDTRSFVKQVKINKGE
jgi:hypothetical protein